MATLTERTKKNIIRFVSDWYAGNIVACKQSYEAAQRYLKLSDGLTDNEIDGLCGLIEYTNFHDRAETSVKNWKL